MKKLLSIAVAILLTVGLASAQSTSGSIPLKSTPTHVETDTASGAVTKTQSGKISIINSKVGVQVDLTSISGTPGGVIRLLGSMNGGKSFARILPTDSLIVGASANQKIKQFVVVNPVYTDYQVQWIATGTHVTKMNTVAIFRKE